MPVTTRSGKRNAGIEITEQTRAKKRKQCEHCAITYLWKPKRRITSRRPTQPSLVRPCKNHSQSEEPSIVQYSTLESETVTSGSNQQASSKPPGQTHRPARVTVTKAIDSHSIPNTSSKDKRPVIANHQQPKPKQSIKWPTEPTIVHLVGDRFVPEHRLIDKVSLGKRKRQARTQPDSPAKRTRSKYSILVKAYEDLIDAEAPSLNKTLTFLDLPGEVRNEIYEYTLMVDNASVKKDPSAWGINTNILLANKQISNEAVSFLRTQNTFIYVTTEKHRVRHLDPYVDQEHRRHTGPLKPKWPKPTADYHVLADGQCHGDLVIVLMTHAHLVVIENLVDRSEGRNIFIKAHLRKPNFCSVKRDWHHVAASLSRINCTTSHILWSNSRFLIDSEKAYWDSGFLKIQEGMVEPLTPGYIAERLASFDEETRKVEHDVAAALKCQQAKCDLFETDIERTAFIKSIDFKVWAPYLTTARIRTAQSIACLALRLEKPELAKEAIYKVRTFSPLITGAGTVVSTYWAWAKAELYTTLLNAYVKSGEWCFAVWCAFEILVHAPWSKHIRNWLDRLPSALHRKPPSKQKSRALINLGRVLMPMLRFIERPREEQEVHGVTAKEIRREIAKAFLLTEKEEDAVRYSSTQTLLTSCDPFVEDMKPIWNL